MPVFLEKSFHRRLIVNEGNHNVSVFTVVGFWMVKGTPSEITDKCLEARKIVKGE
jgi:hypothetical protein